MSATYFQLGQQKTHMQKQIWRKIHRKQIGPNLNSCCLGMVYVCSVLVFQYFLMFGHVLNITWERNHSCILIPYVHISISISLSIYIYMGFPIDTVVKNLPANVGDTRDMGLIPGSGRSPGGGNGNPLQCSCPDNPRDREAWWATVHRVATRWTQLKRLSMHAYIYSKEYLLSPFLL